MYVFHILVGVFLIYLGYQVKIKKDLNLITNYRKKNIKNEKGYANWIGNSEMIAGVVLIISAIATYFTKEIMIISATDWVLVVGLIVSLLVADKKYKK
ncbi:DUF3784 domain-containing protein [Clostridium septicum]|uniref:DUF3784 domain-containing protein n=1 Tax=Clostridium septicum TaxID=1504 RepID=A0A9N7JK00_CLOSE|nr:DUF3784 domain-containing protein [Clostridium septicum]AYE33944.1 hypothetical protein CP523_05375 [Clostridium septicum]MDU1312902.1 DUF3784 domain-containing protein [Clostridium septicum]QAS62096.1 DUF3784 domain-containing protein [Clostridium septicum]UEC21445.1 DUF3784 domain-containing protein [Clostridium septicum]USS00508.1 DUF3784 domain-containing protein [Clostridium septicum]